MTDRDVARCGRAVIDRPYSRRSERSPLPLR